MRGVKGTFTPLPNAPRERKAECHPDRPHYARGRCKPCYYAWRADSGPADDWRERADKRAEELLREVM